MRIARTRRARAGSAGGVGLVWHYDARELARRRLARGLHLEPRRVEAGSRSRARRRDRRVQAALEGQRGAVPRPRRSPTRSTRFDDVPGHGIQPRASAGSSSGRLSNVAVRVEAGWFIDAFPVTERGTGRDVWVHGGFGSFVVSYSLRADRRADPLTRGAERRSAGARAHRPARLGSVSCPRASTTLQRAASSVVRARSCLRLVVQRRRVRRRRPARAARRSREQVGDAEQVLVGEQEVAPEPRALPREDEAALEQPRERAAVHVVDGRGSAAWNSRSRRAVARACARVHDRVDAAGDAAGARGREPPSSDRDGRRRARAGRSNGTRRLDTRAARAEARARA